MENVWLAAAVWLGLALLASVISIRVAISVALIEIMVGALAGNTIGLHVTEWVNFLAGFGAILLTFLAGSEGGNKALAAATELAHRLKAEVHMVCVEEIPRFPTTMDEVIEEETEESQIFARLTQQARTQAKARHVRLETHVIEGHAVSAIVEFVRRGGYDLPVVGYMSHSALYNRIIGSTTDRLVELAPCQVLVIK